MKSYKLTTITLLFLYASLLSGSDSKFEKLSFVEKITQLTGFPAPVAQMVSVYLGFFKITGRSTICYNSDSLDKARSSNGQEPTEAIRNLVGKRIVPNYSIARVEGDRLTVWDPLTIWLGWHHCGEFPSPNYISYRTLVYPIVYTTDSAHKTNTKTNISKTASCCSIS